MLWQPSIRHLDAAGDGFGHVPGAFATLAVADGLSAWDAESQQIPDARADEPPAFLEAHAETAAYPRVELVEQS